MDVSAVNSVSLESAVAKIGGPAKAGAVAKAGGNQSAPFADTIAELLKDVNSQQLQADQAVRQMATGQVDNVHDVVLSVAKADMAFRLALEIRNRLIDSYQEIMRMQV